VHIHRLRLTTDRLALLRRFYVDRLGLPLLAERDGGFAVRAGHTRLAFATAAPGTSPLYHVAFNVPPDRLADAIAWLRPRAGVLAPDGDPVVPFPAWNAHAAYCRDPAGNVVEVIARHDLDVADRRPFGAWSLLGVSEIGLPAPRVDTAVDALARLGVPHYSGNRSSFAALGDSHGLAIVVPTGRPWFPTRDAISAVHPVELELAGPGAWGRVPELGLTVRRV
jgi:catechol-2,3-dioxygenase